MNSATVEQVVGGKDKVSADARDPLDIPYSESGKPKPVYSNAYYPGMHMHIIGQNEAGETTLLWRGAFAGGIARYDTPRQEMYVRHEIRKLLNGNSPDRWMGENLDEEERFVCGGCPFTTLNSKVALDHRVFHKHQQRLD